MKRLGLKTKVLLAAFILGGGAAGATEVVRGVTSADDPVYTWNHVDEEGQPLPSFSATVENAKIITGCEEGTGQLCAEGTHATLPPVQLEYN